MSDRESRVVLDPDMRALIETQRLCFVATVTPDGRPSLSPKGTIRVWDDQHLFFLDIASPGTRDNVRQNPWVEINVVDPLSRRGYRFLGTAVSHADGPIYDTACARIAEEEGEAYPCHGVVLVAVERVLPVISPGYAHVADEEEMRTSYRIRRPELEAEFDAHLRDR